jgi:hypothetical protein
MAKGSYAIAGPGHELLPWKDTTNPPKVLGRLGQDMMKSANGKLVLCPAQAVLKLDHGQHRQRAARATPDRGQPRPWEDLSLARTGHGQPRPVQPCESRPAQPRPGHDQPRQCPAQAMAIPGHGKLRP